VIIKVSNVVFRCSDVRNFRRFETG